MDSSSVIALVQDKLPRNDLNAQILLREKLDKLSEAKRSEFVNKIALLNLKSPALVFWLGNFLLGVFGVARFMIGDKTLGFARLGSWVVYIMSAVIAGVTGVAGVTGSGFFAGLTVFMYFVLSVWWVVDLFLVGKKLRRQNLEKLVRAIDTM